MMLQYNSSWKNEHHGFITIFSDSFVRANKLAAKHYKQHGIKGKPILCCY